MTYQTALNDRRRRRRARLLTALITLTLFAAAAYGLGAFDALLLPDAQPVVAGVAA